MNDGRDTLSAYTDELQRLAERLRSGAVPGDEAARLVERCADLAGRISALLEHEARGMTTELPLDETPEQERLL